MMVISMANSITLLTGIPASYATGMISTLFIVKSFVMSRLTHHEHTKVRLPPCRRIITP
ncbi:hypothetical protein BDV29DRAFT_89997 [Aspergillus leporis]|uniref:Uncharacterized protein n=1 Tax=Aspergillus leporis TaxID=41062 RepID=A0A5N5XAN5_9EURO|nr:hypothetical protein BDV29DRAFT_89997 [Aspergillus leporis]